MEPGAVERRLMERRQRVQERLAAAAHEEQDTPPAKPPVTEGAEDSHAQHQILSQMKGDAGAVLQAMVDHAAAAAEAQATACSQLDEELVTKVQARQQELASRHVQLAATWEALQSLKDPRKLQAAVTEAARQAAELQLAWEGVAAQVQDAQHQRAAQCEALLQQHAQAQDAFMQAAAREDAGFKAAADRCLHEAIALLVQRNQDLRASCRAEFDTLLLQHGAMSADTVRQRLEGRDARQAALEGEREGQRTQHAAMRRQLEGQVATMERHHDAARAAHVLTTEKLTYNCRVLGERERENRIALVHQRHLMHQLGAEEAALQARHHRLEQSNAAEQERLALQSAAMHESVESLKAKMAHFTRSESATTREVLTVKQAEMEGLLQRLAVAADGIQQEVGIDVRLLSACQEACHKQPGGKGENPGQSIDAKAQSSGAVMAEGSGAGAVAAVFNPACEEYWRARGGGACSGLSPELLRRLEEAMRLDLQQAQAGLY